jgi:hypothetical protein
MPKKPPAPMDSHPPDRRSPEELARRSVARLEAVAGDRVRVVLRVTISRAAAEAISAAAIRQEINFATVVEDILETAGATLGKRAG